MKNQTQVELHGEREIRIARTFDAPARIVFDSWTRPELVARWWAPKNLGVSVESVQAEVRVGGSYRYVLRNPDGSSVAFYGEYKELTPPTRLVYTQVFEPFPDMPTLCTVSFEERAGKTRMSCSELYASKEAREATLASGMEHGMRAIMDQLDALVASLA